jgi:hypothetical protein
VSCVYFAYNEEAGLCKIGFSDSDDPLERVRQWSTGTPFSLTVVHEVGATRSDESRLHRRFKRKADAAGSEWFRLDKELFRLIISVRDRTTTICKTLRAKQRGAGGTSYTPPHGPATELRHASDWSRPCPRCGKTQYLSWRQHAKSGVIQDQPYCCRGGKRGTSSAEASSAATPEVCESPRTPC